MKSKKKKLKKIGMIVTLLLVILIMLLSYMLIKLNILPYHYLIVLIVILGIVTLTLSKVMLISKYKVWLKVISIIISLILVIVSIVANIYIFKTYNFMDAINNDKKIYENYYILVLNNTYNKIDELKNKKIGTFNESTDMYDNVIKELDKKLTYTKKEYISIDNLLKSLTNKESDGIILSNIMYEFTKEEDKAFESKVKIIDTIKVEKEDKVKDTNLNISKDVFTIYISGIDTYGDIKLRSRSDVNMLVTINPTTYEILLTSIPRDYYVQLHNTKGYKDKLTHAGIYGVNMSIETIEDLLNINIDYYVRVNFSTLVNVVDIIDGIDINSDASFTPWTDRSFTVKKGMNHFTGKQALAYARERYAYKEGDRHRVQNQQDVITAIIKKLTSTKTLLTKYTTLLNSIKNSFQTNINLDDLAPLVQLQLSKMPNWTIKKYSLNGTNSSGYTYTMGEQKVFVMTPDQKTIDKAYEYISGMKKGKKLSELGL